MKIDQSEPIISRMTDVHTPEQRSFNMSQVRAKNTKPEKLMFSLLKKADYRFKKHYNILGKPDIAFPKYKIAVFIDGEFWHGKNFNNWKYKLPAFWVKKIGDNIKRDKRYRYALTRRGWHVTRLWGKTIVKNPDKAIIRLTRFIQKNLINT